MTENKPIIVYGIDVSECLLFDKRKGICFKNKKSCSAICSYATYKLREQLYYKTQECEELKKEIAFGNNGTLSDKIRAEVFKKLNNENDQLKAENETYKQMLDNPEVRVALTDIRSGERDLWQKYKPRMEQAEQKLKFVENVLSINYQLWMYYIANGINNSSNHTILDLIEDFATSVRLLANTLDIQDNTLNYYTKDSIVYDKKNKELQKLNNEVQNG